MDFFQFACNITNTYAKQIRAEQQGECQRCNEQRILTHRVSSDAMNLRVCVNCASDAKELGLRVERL